MSQLTEHPQYLSPAKMPFAVSPFAAPPDRIGRTDPNGFWYPNLSFSYINQDFSDFKFMNRRGEIVSVIKYVGSTDEKTPARFLVGIIAGDPSRIGREYLVFPSGRACDDMHNCCFDDPTLILLKVLDDLIAQVH